MATSVPDTPAITQAVIPLTTVRDVESSGPSTPRTDANWVPDIEHVYVNDDPRKWSPKLKVSSFSLYDFDWRSRHVLIYWLIVVPRYI